MKLSSRDIPRFLDRPDPAVRLVLVYGPDGGLVRERVQALVRVVAEDPADPFRVAELTAGDVAADPARLADEAAALSLTGGRRAVRVRQADDALAGSVETFLTGAEGDSLVVLEAGDLPGRSALRKVCERAANAAALPCYLDDGRSLPALVDETLGQAGLSLTPEARAYLLGHLGSDRQVTRNELEKLVLYAGSGPNRLDLDAVRASIGDSAARSLEDLSFAVAGGDLAAVERIYQRSLQEGSAPVSVLRAVSRHFQRLHLVAGRIAAGSSPEQAVKGLRPPVFWKVEKVFQGQARSWPPRALGSALGRLLEAESACKRTGAPDTLLCGRALLAIAREAPMRVSAR